MARRRPVVLLLTLVFWGVVAFACVRLVVPRLEEIRGLRPEHLLLSRWTIAATGVLMTYYFAMGGAWLLVLRSVGGRPSIGSGFRAYVLSLLPRYVPGLIASQGVRAKLVSQDGVPLQVVTSSLVLEMAFSLGGAGLIAFGGAMAEWSQESRHAARWLLILVVAGGIAMLVLAHTGRFGRKWHDWTGLSFLRQRPRAAAGFLLTYAGLWAVFGFANWLLANALVPLPISYILPFVVAVAVASGVGILSVFAPAGIGVREGTLFLFVRGWLGASHALIFVALSRLLMVGLEVFLTVGWIGYASLRARPSRDTVPLTDPD